MVVSTVDQPGINELSSATEKSAGSYEVNRYTSPRNEGLSGIAYSPEVGTKRTYADNAAERNPLPPNPYAPPPPIAPPADATPKLSIPVTIPSSISSKFQYSSERDRLWNEAFSLLDEHIVLMLDKQRIETIPINQRTDEEMVRLQQIENRMQQIDSRLEQIAKDLGYNSTDLLWQEWRKRNNSSSRSKEYRNPEQEKLYSLKLEFVRQGGLSSPNGFLDLSQPSKLNFFEALGNNFDDKLHGKSQTNQYPLLLNPIHDKLRNPSLDITPSNPRGFLGQHAPLSTLEHGYVDMDGDGDKDDHRLYLEQQLQSGPYRHDSNAEKFALLVDSTGSKNNYWWGGVLNPLNWQEMYTNYSNNITQRGIDEWNELLDQEAQYTLQVNKILGTTYTNLSQISVEDRARLKQLTGYDLDPTKMPSYQWNQSYNENQWVTGGALVAGNLVIAADTVISIVSGVGLVKAGGKWLITKGGRIYEISKEAAEQIMKSGNKAAAVDDVLKSADDITREIAEQAAKGQDGLHVLQNVGCFTGDTKVLLSAVPSIKFASITSQFQHDSYSSEIAFESNLHAIKDVQLGSRVHSKNPRPEDYDFTFDEPSESSCSIIHIKIERNDGSITHLDLIRPDEWIAQHRLKPGADLKMHLPELEFSGRGYVVDISNCTQIVDGDGSVVTGRIVTYNAQRLVSVTFEGGITLTGTEVHPIWSVDREDWVPLGQLAIGELVSCEHGTVTVIHREELKADTPVYNLEIHGEHVYQVTALGILVHNATPEDCLRYRTLLQKKPADMTPAELDEFNALQRKFAEEATPEHHLATNKNFISEARGGPWSPDFEKLFKGAGIDLDDAVNRIRVPGHQGPHPEAYHQAIYDSLYEVTKRHKPGTQSYKDALIKELDRLAKEAVTPGSFLNGLLIK